MVFIIFIKMCLEIFLFGSLRGYSSGFHDRGTCTWEVLCTSQKWCPWLLLLYTSFLPSSRGPSGSYVVSLELKLQISFHHFIYFEIIFNFFVIVLNTFLLHIWVHLFSDRKSFIPLNKFFKDFYFCLFNFICYLSVFFSFFSHILLCFGVVHFSFLCSSQTS